MSFLAPDRKTFNKTVNATDTKLSVRKVFEKFHVSTIYHSWYQHVIFANYLLSEEETKKVSILIQYDTP